MLGIDARRRAAPPRSRGARAARRASPARLLRRVRDFAAVAGADARSTRRRPTRRSTRLEVDALGLDAMDRRYLRCIAENYGGGPVGVETLAAALSEQRDVIEEVIEPFLIQQGLLQRTPRGRMLTDGRLSPSRPASRRSARPASSTCSPRPPTTDGGAG